MIVYVNSRQFEVVDPARDGDSNCVEEFETFPGEWLREPTDHYHAPQDRLVQDIPFWRVDENQFHECVSPMNPSVNCVDPSRTEIRLLDRNKASRGEYPQAKEHHLEQMRPWNVGRHNVATKELNT